jgi:hypothetical protein
MTASPIQELRRALLQTQKAHADKAMRKLILFSILALLLGGQSFAQGGAYINVASLQTSGNIQRVIPSAPLVVCNFPGTGGTPCTNKATTYTNSTLASSCSTSTQVVVPGTSTCSATADSAGNFGFFVANGTYVYYFQDASLVWHGPYPFAVQLSVPGSGGTIPGVIFPVRFSYVFGRGDGITQFAQGVNVLGTQGAFAITGTEESGRLLTSAAASSTNTQLAVCSATGANPGQGFLSLGTFQRFIMRLETQISTTARYWVGLMDVSAGECGSGNSAYTSDTPNRNYCAFRFSTTTDTTWKAVCATSNVAQTVVDTGVAINTSASVLFEIITTPTSAAFSINGTTVATITTNLPSASLAIADGFQADNKNSNTAQSVAFFWSQTFENK